VGSSRGFGHIAVTRLERGLARDVLLQSLEDTAPSSGHILGVVHIILRQLQEPDSFVAGEVLEIQLLHCLFSRSFSTHRSTASDRPVELEPEHETAFGWNGWLLNWMGPVKDSWEHRYC